jgi:hypothetical protein
MRAVRVHAAQAYALRAVRETAHDGLLAPIDWRDRWVVRVRRLRALPTGPARVLRSGSPIALAKPASGLRGRARKRARRGRVDRVRVLLYPYSFQSPAEKPLPR